MKTTVEIRIDGKLIKRAKCHSWVTGFIDQLQNAFATYYAMKTLVAAGVTDSEGIQVGTGTAAVLITDATLQTLILNGAAPNKLSYGACGVGANVTVGTTRRFTVARTFTNLSGIRYNC